MFSYLKFRICLYSALQHKCDKDKNSNTVELGWNSDYNMLRYFTF